MKFFYISILLMSSTVHADTCSRQSEQFLDLFAVKWGVSSSIKEAPDRYRDEKWTYIHSLADKAFEKGKFDKEASITVSKLLPDNDFSDNPEVETNIFEDYWLLSCRSSKKGKDSKELSKISKPELIKCWDAASSRKEFQKCIAPLLYK